MKRFQLIIKKNIPLIILILLTIISSSCKKSILDEKALSNLGPDNTLNSKIGFDSYLNGLYFSAREEYSAPGVKNMTIYLTNYSGTDIADDAGQEYVTYRNWETYLTPVTPEVERNWNWAYTQMIAQANTIIQYANLPENSEIWDNEADKNQRIAVARFFRGYTYNILANLFGGVPIVDSVPTIPSFSYVRADKDDVYEFAKEDLQFASNWLPVQGRDGEIVKAAADHLLSEVYISLGQYDSAVAAASRVINSGLYHLMTSRFGSRANEPGDVFSDLFRDGNQNRSAGNMESIYVLQFKEFTPGGGGTDNGNHELGFFCPMLVHINDPNGVPMIVTDSMGRGTGRVRPSNYSIYGIWESDWNDMRTSEFNWRRKFYYNNPQSAFFGQEIEHRIVREDTMRSMYPYSRKFEGAPWEGQSTSGKTAKGIYIMRLAETYLLRAEAYLMMGENQLAADDINEVRSRANAGLVQPSEVNIDYILDERARELWGEEPRRRTLTRTNKLVERVRKYALLEGSRNTVQDYNNYWPIPQSAIDANFGAKLEQNLGY